MEVGPNAGHAPAPLRAGGTLYGALAHGSALDDPTLLASIGLPSPPAGPVAPGTVVRLGVAVLRDDEGSERACLRVWVEGGSTPFLRAELTNLDTGRLVALATARGTFGALWPTIERLAFGERGRAD